MENRETWPERISFPVADRKIITHYGADARTQGTVEYIRADLAKECDNLTYKKGYQDAYDRIMGLWAAQYQKAQSHE